MHKKLHTINLWDINIIKHGSITCIIQFMTDMTIKSWNKYIILKKMWDDCLCNEGFDSHIGHSRTPVVLEFIRDTGSSGQTYSASQIYPDSQWKFFMEIGLLTP